MSTSRDLSFVALLGLIFLSTVSAEQPPAKSEAPNWSVKIANIEACSCPAFCQCYFTGQPAHHVQNDKAERFCRFNNAFFVKEGHWHDTQLAGLKFWMAGDLGNDFSNGEMDWAVLHFEPGATPDQRTALESVVHQIFPVKWRQFTIGKDLPITWSVTGERAEAKLDGGRAAEVTLVQAKNAAGEPSVIQNVQFWATSKNDGFHVMPNDVEAYKLGDKPFEFHKSNGFFTTIEMGSIPVSAKEPVGYQKQP